MQIFDRNLVRLHHARAESSGRDADFLWRHCATQLRERLLDIKRDFSPVVEVGPKAMVLDEEFLAQKNMTPHFHVDSDMIADEEFWPFAKQSLQAIVSLGHLHWVNDVPGVLAQFRHSLQPDGILIGAFFGGETLRELRASVAQVEMEIYGGVSPRVSPFIGLPDMAALMQRAQFALPVVDHDVLTVTYATLHDLIGDLRAMGQTNAILKRNAKILARDFWPRVAEFYRRNFATGDGRLQATVEIIYLLGWAPAESQPKPLARGSATHQLVDFLK